MIVACIITMLVASSCGSSRKATAHVHHRQHRKSESVRPTKPEKVAIDPALPEATKALIAEANTWLGVPYKWAGNDRDGVDCSGFVTQVFLRALDIKLPRTSATQNDYCKRLDRSKLTPGDLVFFDTKRDRDGRTSHVGIYVGNGNMIHASSKGGVIITPIDGPFFGDRLLNGGRVEALARKSRDMKSARSERPAHKPTSTPSPKPDPVQKTTPTPTPSPKPAPKPTPKPTPAPAPTPTSKPAAPAPQPTPATPDISAEQARALVLDMLVEEKIDSIYSK